MNSFQNAFHKALEETQSDTKLAKTIKHSLGKNGKEKESRRKMEDMPKLPTLRKKVEVL